MTGTVNRGTALAVLALAATAARCGPQPWQETSYSSYEQLGTVLLHKFDPAMGTLISARTTTSGVANFTLTTPKPITSPTTYDFKTNRYLYFGPASFVVPLKSANSLPPYQTGYTLFAKGNGGETFTGGALDTFKGKGLQAMTFSSDVPEPWPPGYPASTLTPTKLTGGVTIVYHYLPSPKGGTPHLPKEPLPKLHNSLIVPLPLKPAH